MHIFTPHFDANYVWDALALGIENQDSFLFVISVAAAPLDMRADCLRRLRDTQDRPVISMPALRPLADAISYFSSRRRCCQQAHTYQCANQIRSTDGILRSFGAMR